MKMNAVVLSALLFIGINANTYAGGAVTAMVGGATLPEQLVQSATMAEQLYKQAMMVQQQLQMLQNQSRNLQGLPTSFWPNVSGQLAQLIQINMRARALSATQPGVIESVRQQYGDPGQTLTGVEQRYKDWNDNSNSQIASTLESYGYQADHFASEQDALVEVQKASQSATGRLQALQAGNQIAGMQVNQMQLLRATVIQGNQAMLNLAGNQANKEQQERNVINDWMNKPAKRGVW